MQYQTPSEVLEQRYRAAVNRSDCQGETFGAALDKMGWPTAERNEVANYAREEYGILQADIKL